MYVCVYIYIYVYVCMYTHTEVHTHRGLIPDPRMRQSMLFGLPAWEKEWSAWLCPLLRRPKLSSRIFSGIPH